MQIAVSTVVIATLAVRSGEAMLPREARRSALVAPQAININAKPAGVADIFGAPVKRWAVPYPSFARVLVRAPVSYTRFAVAKKGAVKSACSATRPLKRASFKPFLVCTP